jgi:hypothetical protein
VRFFILLKNGLFSQPRGAKDTSIVDEFIFRHVVEFRYVRLRWDDAIKIYV